MHELSPPGISPTIGSRYTAGRSFSSNPNDGGAMKVDEKSGAQVDGRLRLAKSVPRKEATTGGLVQSSTVRSDRVSITADGLVASIESEMAAERKAKIAEISELVNKKTFFQSRPDWAIKSAHGISEDVTLLQDIAKK